jgi:histone H3
VASFYRLVREISQDRRSDVRWQADALKALQTDAEANLTGLFDQANKVRRLCKSKTLRVEHLQGV